jgi:PKD repeat protein
MWGRSTDNNIYCNSISLNNYGIYIKYQTSCNNNNLFHNNFNDNNVNALDGCSNIWNTSYPNGGNYWSDYTGDDNNRGPNQDTSGSDGIGDTVLNISGGGGNKDYFPLMYPWGEQRPVANYTYFEEYGGYVFNASTSYDRDGEIVSFEWDFGDGNIDSGMIVSYAYNASGTYDITLTTTDNEGYKGNHTKTIDAVKNYPPDIPSIDGPSSGGWGKPYHFTFQSSDNEGSDVWYFVDWGDGKDTGWMGPYISGDEISDSHTWTEQETFIIKCKAKDVYGSECEWAEFEIEIPRNKICFRSMFNWLLERFQILNRILFILK